jgi:hypothetical protein
VDSIRVEGGFMFVGMSRAEEGIVKVYNLNAGGASHQLTGHKVCSMLRKPAVSRGVFVPEEPVHVHP